MRIQIVTPAPPGSRHGNRNTALRWAAHLRALGHRVGVHTGWRGAPADLLIALHARRSHAALAAWRKAHPDRPLVLVLTGTDLYRDIRSDADAQASLALADRLVVLQEEGSRELSRAHRHKATVVHQSVPRLKRLRPPGEHFLVTVIGHLREEKEPFCAARALGHLDEEDIRVVQLGKALSEQMAGEARRFMGRDARYRWLGELPHSGAMRWLARSHAMVISSRMEGGAHVVSEAIAAGVPVLASRIPGNVGLLGAGYRGYFPVGDDRALARLIGRSREPQFLRSLEAQVKSRRALVRPAAERRALAALLASCNRSVTF
ncbi:MAG: selenoneine biosynthesis selenosugar synthase SenB [Betaproteobacteria bacterium]